MRVWYQDIPAGIYSTRELIELSEPTQTYTCIYQTLRRWKVKKIVSTHKQRCKNGLKNEMYWQWLGAEHYLNMVEQMRNRPRKKRKYFETSK